MAYKPNQFGEEERSRAYGYTWIAAASSPFNLAFVLTGADFWLYGTLWGLTMGGMLLAAIGDSSDEFYRSRVNVGTRFVMGGIGLYLFAAWLMNIFDLAHSAGYVLASGESAADTGLVGLFWTDALTLASVLSVLFYAGYTFAVIREQRG
jgi:hypothetical protein